MYIGLKNLLAQILYIVFGSKGDYKQLRDNTAIIINKGISEADSYKIRNKMDELIESQNECQISKDETASDTRLIGLEEHIDQIDEILNIKNEIRNIEKYQGKRVKSYFLMGNKVFYKKDNKGSGGGWHKDSVYTHQIKIIWYLSNVKNENGPFQYIKNSNQYKYNKLNENGDKYRFMENDIDKSQIVTVTGKIGTKIVCDTSCIHRGSPIVNGERYAITLYTSHKKNYKDLLFGNQT